MRSLIALAVVFVAACDGTVDPPTYSLADGGSWERETDLGFVSASFDPDGTVRAQGVCDRYAGAYEASGAQISITLENVSQRTCGALRNEIEKEFVDGLRTAERFEIDGVLLTLDGPEGTLQLQYRTPGVNL